MLQPHRRPATECANHAGVPSGRRCMRCRNDFCDACLVYVVNDAAWCEVCGNHEVATGNGRPALAVLAFVALLAAWLAFMAVQVLVIHVVWIASWALLVVPFFVAWRIALPETPGAKPIVVDRRQWFRKSA